MNELVFASKNLNQFGLYVDSANSWNKPLRTVTKVQIPGRSGDLVIDEGTFNNVTIAYRCFMMTNFVQNFTDLMAWLGSQPGYQRLEFTGDPQFYRMARIQTDVNPTTTAFLRHGNFTLSFDCKPQRWLKIGEGWTEFNASGAIYNPTHQVAHPIIRLYGTGTLQIGGVTITVSTAGTSYIDIDTETMNAYEGSYSRNSNVSFSSYDQIGLNPGSNGLTINSLTKVGIQPRWWEI